MQIAFIVGAFPVLSESFILNQITGLLNLGHKVDIFARNNPQEEKIHPDVIKYQLLENTRYYEPQQENKLKRFFRTVGVSIQIICRNPLIFIRALFKFKYYRDKFCLNIVYLVSLFLDSPEYDIIHCHFGPNGNLGVLLKSVGVKGKLITMFHGYDIRLGIKKGGNIYHELFEYGDCFLANSDYSYKHLVKFGAAPKKIILHPVGVDLKKFVYRLNADKIKQPKPVKILTVARLVEEKGIEYGIQTIYRVVKCKPMWQLEYQIIGGGHLREKLEELTKELEVDDMVFFLGPRQQKEVIQLMQQAHLFLLPSTAEAFGLVLLEAQAVGLPIIATSIGSQPIINGKSGFLVPPKDVDTMVDRLIYLINHPELWIKMGRIGRKFVEEHYDLEKLNIKLVQIYKELISKAS
jgi:colanic acid/amylovoran biosynthesis glycosyltransferase